MRIPADPDSKHWVEAWIFFFSRNAAAKALIDQIDLSSLPTREASHSEDPLPYLKYMHELFNFLAKKQDFT
jgi:hypothetical protein